MKILFKYPTFKRPDLFIQTLEKYYSMLSDKIDYEFLITLNIDDETMNTRKMERRLDFYPDLRYKFGLHKTKIEAVNADMEGEDFDILYLISDDMIPQQPGFDLIIMEDMQKHFPNMDGALSYDDGYCARDKFITLSIMGKKLYDHFGYIYHPDYKSLFCDEEFTNVVFEMGKAVYIPKLLVKHEWKGGRNGDETYRNSSATAKMDQATFLRRKELGYPK